MSEESRVDYARYHSHRQRQQKVVVSDLRSILFELVESSYQLGAAGAASPLAWQRRRQNALRAAGVGLQYASPTWPLYGVLQELLSALHSDQPGHQLWSDRYAQAMLAAQVALQGSSD